METSVPGFPVRQYDSLVFMTFSLPPQFVYNASCPVSERKDTMLYRLHAQMNKEWLKKCIIERDLLL